MSTTVSLDLRAVAMKCEYEVGGTGTRAGAGLAGGVIVKLNGTMTMTKTDDQRVAESNGRWVAASHARSVTVSLMKVPLLRWCGRHARPMGSSRSAVRAGVSVCVCASCWTNSRMNELKQEKALKRRAAAAAGNRWGKATWRRSEPDPSNGSLPKNSIIQAALEPCREILYELLPAAQSTRQTSSERVRASRLVRGSVSSAESCVAHEMMGSKAIKGSDMCIYHMRRPREFCVCLKGCQGFACFLLQAGTTTLSIQAPQSTPTASGA